MLSNSCIQGSCERKADKGSDPATPTGLFQLQASLRGDAREICAGEGTTEEGARGDRTIARREWRTQGAEKRFGEATPRNGRTEKSQEGLVPSELQSEQP